MSLAIIILGVMYLMGYDIGTALAISSIVTGVLISVVDILKAINKEQEKGWRQKKWKEQNQNSKVLQRIIQS